MKLWPSKIFSVACLLIVLAATPAIGQTVLLSDNMSTGVGWTYSHLSAVDGTAKPVPPLGGGSDNQEADFGFDYSAFGIPEAPNSDAGDPATEGLRLADNLNGFFDDVGVAAVFEDANFDDQYTVQVDAWLNWSADPAQIGTTEHAGVYAGFDTTAAQATNFPAQSGAGVLFDTDGGFLNADYVLAKDEHEPDLSSGQYLTTDFGFGNQPGIDQSDGPFPALFPSFDIAAATNNMNGTGTQRAGAAGFQWVTITAEVDANAVGNGSNGSLGTTKFTITNAASGQSQLIGTVDNSVDDDPNDGFDTGEHPVGMEGAIALMMVDFFSGAPNDATLGFILYDNVRVFDGFLTGNDPDVDADLDVDGKDFLEIQRTDPLLIPDWEAEFGNGVGPLAGVGAVPEPATALLMALGAAWVVARRR